MPVKQEPLRYAHDEGHTDVCFSSDGSTFITCGADGDIRIWPTSDSEDPVHNCIGEWALSVRHKGDSLYVATGSNDVQILTYPEGERNGVLARFVAPINHIAISQSSEHIALAGEDMEVKLIDLERTEDKITTFEGATGPVLSVAICPSCRFLASSSGDGKLRVWEISTRGLVKEIECFPKTNSFSNAKLLCRVDFEPQCGKILAYPDKNSVVFLNTGDWSQNCILKCEEMTSDFSILQFSPCGRFLIGTTADSKFVIFNVASNSVLEWGEGLKRTAISGLMWNPNNNGQIVFTDTEGELGIWSSCLPSGAPTEDLDLLENRSDAGFPTMDDDDDEDGENVISVEKLKKQVMGDFEPELVFDEDSVHSHSIRPRTPDLPLQPPFMPTSTPEHLNPRYLCWNEVGIIRLYNSEDDSIKSIEVEFHDSTFHNSMMINNFHDYTMGSLSKSALMVANSAQINVIPLSQSSKEWTLKVGEDGEKSDDVVLIAATDNLISFCTSGYMVRVYSIFGTQRGVALVPGPPLSISGYQNSLLVAYHASGGVRVKDQCVNLKMISFKGFSLRCVDIQGALGPESTLLWVGFSDCGTPAMMDSLGIVSLYPKRCNIWIPFCDTTRHRKSPADGFFLTSLSESLQALVGIKCKGTMYPGFTPRPTVCELPLESPFCEPATEKTQMESSLFTMTNLNSGCEVSTKKFMEMGLKTFALACKNGLDQRALELMEILGNPQILNLSTKYAAKLNKKLLAEKLMELVSKLNHENQDDDYEDGGNYNSINYNTNSNSLKIADLGSSKSFTTRKLTLSAKKTTTPRTKLLPKSPDKVHEPAVIEDSQNVDSSFNETMDDSGSTQESAIIAGPARKNPFLKSLKKGVNQADNPLSLTDKFAGVEDLTRNGNRSEASGEKNKRKLDSLDSGVDEEKRQQNKEKQRKLDRFMFTKTISS